MKRALLLLALLPQMAAAQIQIVEDEPTAALRRLPILMVDATDGETEETGLTVTCTLSENGATYASGGGSVTEVGNGLYYYAAATTDVNTPGFLAYRCTATGADTYQGLAQILEAHDGTAQAGAAGTITLDSGSSATDDLYNGRFISIDQGTGAGQTRCIIDYVGSSKVASIAPNWTTNPSSDSEYVFGDSCDVNVARLSGDSGAADNLELDYDGTGYAKTNSTTGLNNDAITAAKIAADAIGASEIAAGAIVKGTEATGWNDVSAATVNAEVVDALATDTYAELSACPTGTATLANKISFIYQWFLFKKDKDATTEQLYKDDGSTVLCDRTYSDAAGTYTLGEYATP